jgi:inhibitor of cysteine peptidase
MVEKDRAFRLIHMTSLSLETVASKGYVLALCAPVVCVGIAFVSSGCVNSAKESAGELDVSEIVIVQSDQGKTFEVRQGDLISFRLAENPTTGYQWEVDAADDRVIALQDSDYSMAPGAGIGGGGTRTFTFKAQSSDTVQVRLKLRREWEPEDTALDRFEVTIRVQGE